MTEPAVALYWLVTGAVAVAVAGFATSGFTERSTERMEARCRWFRRGLLPLLAGSATTSLSEALRWFAHVAGTDPLVTALRLAGLAFVLGGLLVVDAVLWWPGEDPVQGTRGAKA